MKFSSDGGNSDGHRAVVNIPASYWACLEFKSRPGVQLS
jgi:hypothetical protein